MEVELLLRVCPDEEDTINQIVNLLVDTCSSKRRMLRVAGDDKPAEVVRSRFMKLNADHIRFVLKCLAESTAPVRNMKQYLLAALYNAPTTIRMEQEKNTLSVLQIAPGQHPKPIEIDNDLKALQQAVGGSIGASYPFEDPVAIVYNDDGKLMGLPLNRALRDESGEAYDVVAGTFLVVGLGEEDFASLSPELTQKYEELFHQPETFMRLGRQMLVLPVPDENVRTEIAKAKPPAAHER